jgi:bifunctional non-homologous end joining protein LigD
VVNGAVRVGRRSISLSKPDKVLFPEGGYAKADVVEYFRRIAPFMVPEIRGRAMTLERFPDGIEGGRVFSKGIPKYFPAWIDRAKLKKEGGSVTHVVCNDAATLVYLANQATITQHVGLSRVDRIDNPDQIIFDLDPSSSDFAPVRAAAKVVKALLHDVGLSAFVKTSGSKGLHVVAPLDRSATFDVVRAFARDFASLLAARHPGELTVEFRKDKRRGRLLVDWMRNAYGQTAVAPYSLRARPGAPVAMPIGWDEVEDDALTARRYTIENALEHAARHPWKGWRRHARALTKPRRHLDSLIAER